MTNTQKILKIVDVLVVIFLIVMIFKLVTDVSTIKKEHAQTRVVVEKMYNFINQASQGQLDQYVNAPTNPQVAN